MVCPGGEDDWVGEALLARAKNAEATIRERSTAAMGLCNEWPDIDEGWFRHVQAAPDEPDGRQIRLTCAPEPATCSGT